MTNPLRHLISPIIVLAALAAGIIPLLTYAIAQGGSVWPDAYALRITSFTIWQATLSTLLSVTPAIPIARALARQNFPGRNLLLALFAVPLSLPVIVAVFGIATLYGNSGLFGGLLDLYGPQGIIFAHVFFNLPLAVRLLLEALNGIPAENHRLAAQLDFKDRDTWRHVDWPALRPVLPRVASLVFVLCAASFVIVLTFGGPAATTLEVAIYQSLRMDFDVSRALVLSLIQLLLSILLVWTASKALTSTTVTTPLRLVAHRSDGGSFKSKLADAAVIATAILLVLPPLLAICATGFMHIDLSATFLRALVTSAAIACVSALLALALAWGLATSQARLPKYSDIIMVLGLGGYLAPPAVLSTGWFLTFRSLDGGVALSFMLIAAMNALMALPFLLSVVGPALHRSFAQHDRLCASLAISGFNRWRLVDAPSIRSAFALAGIMAFVLSLGDLTAVTLLGTQGLLTLPSLIQQQMGHYQSEAAGGTALVLALLCFSLAHLSQRLARSP